MKLNDIKPAEGAKHSKRRVGRGIGSGLGKTGGRGHNGQKSRSGGFHKVGFEGGQMPLQRRLPKRGFVSLTRDDTVEVRLSALDGLEATTIDLNTLKVAGARFLLEHRHGGVRPGVGRPPLRDPRNQPRGTRSASPRSPPTPPQP